MNHLSVEVYPDAEWFWNVKGGTLQESHPLNSRCFLKAFMPIDIIL